jgi:hypothetical protein
MFDKFSKKSINKFQKLRTGEAMKLLITISLLLTSLNLFAGAVGSDCTFKGKKLAGKIQFVNSFPDIKVQVVTSFPDLKVQKVSSFPSDCGKWQEVTSFPDIKVQIVTSFPDIKIQYVDSFPGVP